jgi:hypothetical protein
MVAAPTIRDYSQVGSMPTQASGDVILAFAFNYGSTTVPTFSADWTVLGSRTTSYGAAVAYKISNGSSTIGTITNGTPTTVVTVAGASTAVSTGSSPSFSGGVTSTGGTTGMTVPAMSYAPALLRLTAMTFIGGGGNPASPTLSPGTLKSRYQFSGYARTDFYTGSDYGTITVTPDPSYGFSGCSILSIQILPPSSSGFFAMF